MKVGDVIHVKVMLRDSRGKQKTSGGDFLRARIFNDELKAYASCRIVDHQNGTYSVYAHAFWEGHAKFEIELLFQKEVIEAGLRTRQHWVWTL